MEPLVKVLRLADGDGSSSGYILFAIKLAKEGIKEFFHHEAENYSPFIDIIEDRYKRSLKCDLYAAAAYLNPHLFYDRLIKMDKEIKEGLENVVRKLLPSKEAQSAIMKELRIIILWMLAFSVQWQSILFTYLIQVSFLVLVDNYIFSVLLIK
jgi:hypothetical protein